MLLYFSLTLLLCFLVFRPSHGPAPKGSVLDFGLDSAGVVRAVQDAVQAQRAVMDAVARVSAPTFASVVAPLARASQDVQASIGVAVFLKSVAVDKEVRDASINAYKLVHDFGIECDNREDVYRAVRAVFDDSEEMSKLDHEDRRLVERMVRNYRRDGILLPPETRRMLAAVRRQLADVALDFDACIKEEDAKVLFTRGELEGLPEDYFDRRATDDADGELKFVVTSKYPDYFPLLRYAKHERTRRAMLVAAETRCPANIGRLQEMVRLRLEEARLLGYRSHSEYVMEVLMAKTPQTALAMEEDLRARLEASAKKELAELAALKLADKQAAGEPFVGFYNWDTAYYRRITKESKHNIREDELKQYLSLDNALRGVLDIYQKMLGLRIAQVANPPVWHAEVAMYEVWEADGDVFVGHFYLDLHPREGKYNHAAVWPIRLGFTRPDGSREYPVAAMVANFPRATSAAPALLPHSDVTTLMHELGHVFHNLCAHTKWAYFHGTAVERDFVEAPSQMLENWASDPVALRKFAVHYETGEPIPEALVAGLVDAKNKGAGLALLTPVFLGMYDLAIHSTVDGKVDVLQMYNSMRSDIAMVGNGDAETHKLATFGHLAHGYSARVYGYLWSRVFSADMYASRFKRDGVDNTTTGMDYRTEILRPGGSRDAMESMVRFLGRAPNNRAFLESIGLEAQ